MSNYNGWTNYATWRINLEIIDGMTRRDFIGGRPEAYELSKTIKEYVAELICETASEGLARDYALAFISDVNWYEIAEHVIDASDDENDE